MAAAQVRQQHRRDPRVVLDHLALGEAGRGIEDLVEVGEREPAPLDLDLHALGRGHPRDRTRGAGFREPCPRVASPHARRRSRSRRRPIPSARSCPRRRPCPPTRCPGPEAPDTPGGPGRARAERSAAARSGRPGRPRAGSGRTRDRLVDRAARRRHRLLVRRPVRGRPAVHRRRRLRGGRRALAPARARVLGEPDLPRARLRGGCRDRRLGHRLARADRGRVADRAPDGDRGDHRAVLGRPEARPAADVARVGLDRAPAADRDAASRSGSSRCSDRSCSGSRRPPRCCSAPASRRPIRCSRATSASARRATRTSTSPTSRSPPRRGSTTGSRSRSCSRRSSWRARAAPAGSANGSPRTSSTRSPAASRSAPPSGMAAAWSVKRLRDRELLAPALDGYHAIATVLVIYGLAEVAGDLRLPRGVRRRARVPPLRARPRGQRQRARGRRADGEAARAGRDPAARLAADAVRPRAAGLGGLAARGAGDRRRAPARRAWSRSPARSSSARARRRSWPGSACAASARCSTWRPPWTPALLAADERDLLVWTVIACVLLSIVVHGITRRAVDAAHVQAATFSSPPRPSARR